MPAKKSSTGITNYDFADDPAVATRGEQFAGRDLEKGNKKAAYTNRQKPISGIGGQKAKGATRTRGGKI